MPRVPVDDDDYADRNIDEDYDANDMIDAIVSGEEQ